MFQILSYPILYIHEHTYSQAGVKSTVVNSAIGCRFSLLGAAIRKLYLQTRCGLGRNVAFIRTRVTGLKRRLPTPSRVTCRLPTIVEQVEETTPRKLNRRASLMGAKKELPTTNQNWRVDEHSVGCENIYETTSTSEKIADDNKDSEKPATNISTHVEISVKVADEPVDMLPVVTPIVDEQSDMLPLLTPIVDEQRDMLGDEVREDMINERSTSNSVQEDTPQERDDILSEEIVVVEHRDITDDNIFFKGCNIQTPLTSCVDLNSPSDSREELVLPVELRIDLSTNHVAPSSTVTTPSGYKENFLKNKTIVDVKSLKVKKTKTIKSVKNKSEQSSSMGTLNKPSKKDSHKKKKSGKQLKNTKVNKAKKKK